MMIVGSADTLADQVKLQHTLDNTVSSVDYRKQWTSWKKDQFRKSSKWRDFVKHMLMIRSNKCEICHTDKDLVVHHKNPLDYENLSDVDDFAVLCCRCHLKIEANCKSKELMDAHPEYKKWYTYYPYSYDTVKWQSGYRTIKRWDRERAAEINKPKTVVAKKQRDEALQFMRAHPELFE